MVFEASWAILKALGGVLRHLGRPLWPISAVLGDLDAAWWRLGPFEPRFTPKGGWGGAGSWDAGLWMLNPGC